MKIPYNPPDYFHLDDLLSDENKIIRSAIRDWVDSPEGSAYGVLHSSDQMSKAALLNRPLIKGLYFAGQSVLAPGILGTLIGSLSTAKAILGTEQFCRNFRI